MMQASRVEEKLIVPTAHDSPVKTDDEQTPTLKADAVGDDSDSSASTVDDAAHMPQEDLTAARTSASIHDSVCADGGTRGGQGIPHLGMDSCLIEFMSKGVECCSNAKVPCAHAEDQISSWYLAVEFQLEEMRWC